VTAKDPWRYFEGGLHVALKVTPRGGRDEVDGVETLPNGRSVVKLRVRAIAEGGEANAAVVRLLADKLGVAKSAVRIVSGTTSRLKQADITGDPRRLAEIFRKALANPASESSSP
jgi:uncharacterized protein